MRWWLCRTQNLGIILAYSVLCFVKVQAAAQDETTYAAASRLPKPGLCPKGFTLAEESGVVNSTACSSSVIECEHDSSCRGDLKCCTNGCASLCMMPILTGCQQLRMARERHMRQLGGQEESDVEPLQCDEATGEFKNIQCSEIKRQCWCVDQQGLELPGTRGRSFDLVNCSAPKECAGHLCRMLCPYGFELDEEGCPLCECRNPCKNIHCPAGQDCQLDERPCAHPPCPPLPTCRRPRSLTNLCPVGEPLKSPSNNRPFLCGIQATKPQCPLNYLCSVEDGNDYGVCCPLVDKPGQCPSEEGVDFRCGPLCHGDMECEGVQKCCPSSSCGNTCVNPANTTLCLQQKAVVELLIKTNEKYGGYVPQCSPSGDFIPKQCSNNGLLCWCVDQKGIQIRGTMGPAPTVSCDVEGRAHGVATTRSSVFQCKETTCHLECKWGYEYDRNGCIQCACADPCKDLRCPFGSECLIMKEDPCVSGFCPPIATCSQRQNVCMRGPPLIDVHSGELVQCKGSTGCPEETHHCVAVEENGHGVCCIKETVLALKAGTCPDLVLEPEGCSNSTCKSDYDCEDDMKCCETSTCGKICMQPAFKKLPTMCEYLNEVGNQLEESNGTGRLAIPLPQCREDGSYEPIQCDSSGACWCVNEFGVELHGTRAKSREEVNCHQVRARLDCLGLLCRLGCEYGFELDKNGCPLCECRDPCKGAQCPENLECQLVEVKCSMDWCPRIPQCVSQQSVEILQRSFVHCPIGNALMYDDGSEWPVLCNPEVMRHQCPNTHYCYSDDSRESGICCPKTDDILEDKEGECPQVKPWEIGVCAEQCNHDQDCPGPQKCCLNGCNSKVCRNPAGSSGKLGQCPYLIPLSSEKCEYQCSSDYDCSDSEKCCSNGCGTECRQPLKLTGCQHQRLVAAHHAREKGLSLSRVTLPECRREDGSFEEVQCDTRSNACWCADENGIELPGTRSALGSPVNCTVVHTCPYISCDVRCAYGFKLDKKGCPICQCKDPCQGVQCKNPREECQVSHVNCVKDPCPPVALCVPRPDSICPIGEPLKMENNELMHCGPLGGPCPSSHRCHLSPLSESGACCLKLRDVCNSKRETGFCKATIPRWYFNKNKNRCEEFQYSGCGGNLNNFETKEHCETICPVSSTCEKVKQRSLKLKTNYNKIVFMPKCHKTGEWAPIQCLESIGLCWCVDKNGNQISGTVVRGTPACSSRGGRSLEQIPICPNGEPVHICPSDLCQNKICLNYSDSVCRINPCGGCKIEFYDSKNKLLDCNKGLSGCQEEAQRVLNSNAWLNQGILASKAEGSGFDSMDNSGYLPPPPTYPPPPPLIPVSLRKHLETLDMMVAESRLNEPTRTRETRSLREHMQTIARNVRILQVPASKISVLVTPSMKDVTVRMSTDLMPLVEIMKDLSAMESMGKPFVKGGMCPLPSLPSILSSMIRGCEDKCMVDSECPGSKKCCLGQCGLACVDPLVLIPRSSQSKPGQCPPIRTKPRDYLGCLMPHEECIFDDDCRGVSKCCSTPCGHRCSEPMTSKLKPVAMVLAPPKCSMEGGYSITQQQGELSWCVNKYGEAFHNTLTRGMVRCDSNGTIVAREEIGPVCPDGANGKPRVCKTECLHAKCVQHPRAICVADPCNNCAVTFIDKQGKPVNCDEKCSQPDVTDVCPGSNPAFFYNQTSHKCEEFLYGECEERTENVFEKLEDCEESCMRTVPACKQQLSVGNCDGHVTRWFFNKEAHACEMFEYSGCGGNANNFETKEQCEARCPDLVVCPWASVTGEDLQACSREHSCHNATCPAHPSALCTADPCTCSPVFVDASGKPVPCDARLPSSKSKLPFLMSAKLPLTTRCLSLQSQHTPDRRKRYIPQCDSQGGFVPMQCTTGHTRVKECWCVDDAGNQVAGTATFQSSLDCKRVKIKQVDVTLSFSQDSFENSVKKAPQIRSLMNKLLLDQKAHLKEKEPQIAVQSEATNILFTLVGDNKVEVAFRLEEMVRKEALSMVFEDVVMHADYRNSHFYHIPDNSPGTNQEALEDNNAILEQLTMPITNKSQEPFSTGTIVAIVIIALFFICTMVFLFGAIVVHRRKSNGYKPKTGFPTLAFSSPIYDLAMKICKGPPKVVEECKDVNLCKMQSVDTSEEEVSPPSSCCDDVPPTYEEVKEVDNPNIQEKL